MIDFELTDEQKLIRETARDFSDKEIAPRARENDRNEHFDTELVKKMADMGFLGAIVPEEYGGRGVDYLTYGLIVEEIGRNDSAMRTVVSVQTSVQLVALTPSCWMVTEPTPVSPSAAVAPSVTEPLTPPRPVESRCSTSPS